MALARKHNKYNLEGEYGIGYTFKGEEFYFDLEDIDIIKDYCWWMHTSNYMSTNIPGYSNPRFEVLMHRMILGLDDPTIQVDHINRNRVDNRKENLRIANVTNNSRNRTRDFDNKSGFIGVMWDKRQCLWRAYLTADKKWMHLGNFNDKENAILARLQAELKYFGIEFAPQRHLFEEYNII